MVSLLLRITVQLALPGIVSSVYVPAGTVLSPKVKSLLAVSLVDALAPVRHSSPSGSSPPKIFRPFTPGLEYSIEKSVSPTRWSTLALGLGAGVSGACAKAPVARSAATTDRDTHRPDMSDPPGRV